MLLFFTLLLQEVRDLLEKFPLRNDFVEAAFECALYKWCFRLVDHLKVEDAESCYLAFILMIEYASVSL